MSTIGRLTAAVLALLCVALTVVLPAAPAAAAEPLCSLIDRKPWYPPPEQGSSAGMPVDPPEHVVPCDDLAKYPVPSGVMAENGVTDSAGVNIDNYLFRGEDGASSFLSNPDGKAELFLTNLLFSLAKLLVWLSCWLLRFAVKFGVADALLGPVQHMADAYQTHFVDRLGVTTVMLMLCVAWFGMAALRGRVGKGVGEMLISFSLAAVGALVLAAPADTLLGDEGLLGRSRDLAVGVAALPLISGDGICSGPDGCTDTESPGDITPDELVTPLQNALVDTFIRQPHQQMAYGVIFDGTGHPCADAYNTIIKQGPAADGDYMVKGMQSCDPQLSGYLTRANWSRPVVALLLVVAALITFAYLAVGVVVPMIGGQIALAFLAVTLTLALPLSLAGGAARRPLWLWVGSTLSTLLALITPFASLAFFLVTVNAIATYQQISLVTRMVLIVVTALVLIVVHHRIMKLARHVGRHAGRALDRRRIGGSGLGYRMTSTNGAWTARTLWREGRNMVTQSRRTAREVSAPARRLHRRLSNRGRRGGAAGQSPRRQGLTGRFRRQPDTAGRTSSPPPPPADSSAPAEPTTTTESGHTAAGPPGRARRPAGYRAASGTASAPRPRRGTPPSSRGSTPPPSQRGTGPAARTPAAPAPSPGPDPATTPPAPARPGPAGQAGRAAGNRGASDAGRTPRARRGTARRRIARRGVQPNPRRKPPHSRGDGGGTS
ncbi:hypothetical protein [Micromonospora aurantiaca (nom. illeg.)]|uniref:hypothetical protein n=1 Tax=Micromonospora aurantiaca (nom. illeg.) TaxID=47850 RepID=UPI00340F6D2A